MNRLPAWTIDLLVAGALLLLAVGVERLTQGRIANETLALWIGGGMFVLLRLGATLARAGRTLGCLFTLGATWLIPCLAVGALVSSSEAQRIVRDSLPLFLLLGGYLIAFLAITFERLRRYDNETGEG